MLGRHVSLGVLVLALAAAAAFAAQQPTPGPAASTLHRSIAVANLDPNAPVGPAIRTVALQPKDYLTQQEQIALKDPSWKRSRPLTDF
jgi:hypothetical protein